MSEWSHDIRALDRCHRIALPELAVLDAGPDKAVVGALSARGWELRIGRRLSPAPIVPDDRGRVVVPMGVRHCLGLDGPVVVSLAADGHCVLLWPSRALDSYLEVPS